MENVPRVEENKEMTPRLRLIPEMEVVEHWPAIFPKLQEMHGGQGEAAADWEPNDLLEQCMNGYASLFLAPDDDGFVIAQPRINPKTGGTRMVVAAACGLGVVKGRYDDDLVELAQVIGASEMIGFTQDGDKLVEIVLWTEEVPRG